MTDIDALVNRLLQKRDEIFERVEQESIDVYKYLMTQYRAGCVDDNVFRFVYSSFYGLNRWLPPKMKDKYFMLFEKTETSFEEVLEELHKHESYGGKQKYHLSFATKLLHTINDKLPIYDGNVGNIKEFKFPTKRKSCEDYLDIYEQLKRAYIELLKDEHIQSLITEFKKRYDAKSISDAKALDFMLWALGKPKKVKDPKDGNHHQSVLAKS